MSTTYDRAFLSDDDGTPLRGSCSQCERIVDSTDGVHRVSPIFRGGRGVECKIRGDIDAGEAADAAAQFRDEPSEAEATGPELPADPDSMNEQRADWALRACQRFTELTSQSDEWTAMLAAILNPPTDDTRRAAAEVIGDLVCDLHHLADRQAVDWSAVLGSATDHYAAETYEEPPVEQPCACGAYGDDHADDCPMRGWQYEAREPEVNFHGHCECGCGQSLHARPYVAVFNTLRRMVPWYASTPEHAARIVQRLTAHPFTAARAVIVDTTTED